MYHHPDGIGPGSLLRTRGAMLRNLRAPGSDETCVLQGDCFSSAFHAIVSSKATMVWQTGWAGWAAVGIPGRLRLVSALDQRWCGPKPKQPSI